MRSIFPKVWVLNTPDTQPMRQYASDNIINTMGANVSNGTELSNSVRFTRFNNPLIRQDYRAGNYLKE